jgi:hypothetical protein
MQFTVYYRSSNDCQYTLEGSHTDRHDAKRAAQRLEWQDYKTYVRTCDPGSKSWHHVDATGKGCLSVYNWRTVKPADSDRSTANHGAGIRRSADANRVSPCCTGYCRYVWPLYQLRVGGQSERRSSRPGSDSWLQSSGTE